MKIVKEYPPNFKLIALAFNLQPGVIFTYGDTIYNPTGAMIDLPLMKHEEVHMRQQEAYGVKKWWGRYLVDKDFRTAEEVEAFQEQYLWIKRAVNDRNRLAFYLNQLAGFLSSGQYGNILTLEQARQAISSTKKYKFSLSPKS